jgi:polyisoprenoid-binding protein YceI
MEPDRQPQKENPFMSKSINLSAFVLGAALLLPLAGVAKADTYKLDPNHTSITWHVSHFGFSEPSGKFMNVDGTLVLDETNPSTSSVRVTIPIAGLDTGLPKFDEHLKSKDFLDADDYPTATFASNTVDITGKDTAIVHGSLTLHGVMKPVDLKVKLNKIGENMFKKKTAGFSVTASFKRSDFGIMSYLPNVGDEVAIDIESEANVPTP